MNQIYKLFCMIGLHQSVRGKGWVEQGGGNSVYHEGDRCIWCGKFKDGTKESAA